MSKTSEVIPLNPERIVRALRALGYHSELSIHAFDTIDSTNEFLKYQPATPSCPTLCIAETQTAGRGRFGRVWHSPHGCHIYCSIRYYLPVHSAQLSALSLVVSLSLVNTIKALGLPTDNLRIKWPNDLLWQTRKLSGILIELADTGQNHTEVILGIGLNVNTQNTHPWCSLQEITGRYFDRNLIVAQLIHQLQCALGQYIASGFSGFKAKWKSLDYLYQQPIRVVQNNRELKGYAHGITSDGHLILLDEHQQRHELASGETSLSV